MRWPELGLTALTRRSVANSGRYPSGSCDASRAAWPRRPGTLRGQRGPAGCGASRAASPRRAADGPPPVLDRRDLFLFGDAERGAAAAGRDHVRVVHLEARALEAV